MLEVITITLILTFFIGVKILMVLQDIQAANARIAAALTTIAANKAAAISPADAAGLQATAEQLATQAEAIAAS